MKRQYIHKLFINFLQNNNVFYKYYYNCFTKAGFTLRKHVTLSKLLVFGKPNDYIEHAFLWNDTQEGFIFWKNLHKKWNSFYETHVTIPIEYNLLLKLAKHTKYYKKFPIWKFLFPSHLQFLECILPDKYKEKLIVKKLKGKEKSIIVNNWHYFLFSRKILAEWLKFVDNIL